jgi:hypothetical protein
VRRREDKSEEWKRYSRILIVFNYKNKKSKKWRDIEMKRTEKKIKILKRNRKK